MIGRYVISSKLASLGLLLVYAASDTEVLQVT